MEVRGYRVFYIDSEEELNELIELIKKTTASKIALVVHNRLLLNSMINLRLIKQYADRYNKEIVFVNPDPIIIDKVNHAGLTIFPNLNDLEVNIPFQAEAAGVEGDQDKVDKENFPKSSSKFLSLIGIFLILFMAYLYFFYPTATIEIKPVVKEARQELEIYGGFNLNKIDWEKHILPLHEIKVELTDEDEVETTGAKLIGETKATGLVKFINESQEDLLIPMGTIVQTEDGVKFKTLTELVVPKLKVDYLMDVPVGMKAGQAEGKIEALKKGNIGNISTGRIKKLQKELKQVHVINPEPTRGGKDKRISVVNENDLKRLKENLEERLKSRLVAKVYQRLGGNYRIIDEEIEFSEIEFNFNHQLDELADKVKATANLSARGYLLKNSELDRLLTKIFQENLQNGLQLMSSGINIKELELAESKEELYNIKLELVAPVISKINSSELINELQGLDIKTANKVLNERSDIDEYEIKTEASSLPKFGFAINVVISEPDSFKVFQVDN